LLCLRGSMIAKKVWYKFSDVKKDIDYKFEPWYVYALKNKIIDYWSFNFFASSLKSKYIPVIVCLENSGIQHGKVLFTYKNFEYRIMQGV
jgi:hypothetical protein